MARTTQALERWTAADLRARALTPPTGEGEAGPTLLVLLDHGTAADQLLAGVLAQAAAAHSDRVQAAAVAADQLQAELQAWQEKRGALNTYDFAQVPLAAVFRRGRLVTTFHPRQVFFNERLQRREAQEQLEIFLAKMVYYDPARVKLQKNLEQEAGA